MRKVLSFVLPTVIIVIGISLFLLYFLARQPMHQAVEDGREIAEQELDLASVEKSYQYNGTSSYTVVVGEDANGDRIVAWVPEDGAGDDGIETRILADGATEEQVLSMLADEDEVRTVESVKLGLESIGPVWEIKYEDEDETLNYYYVAFDTGEWWRTIKNL